MPIPHNRARELLFSALDAADRVAFLDEACAGDAALRARVEELLRAHDASDNPLDRPAVDLGRTGPFTPLPDMVGALVGPYKLLQQIGEGGFGTVFMAEQQEPVRRMVALKIIKPGMDSAQVLARFESERQALALMDHPNIARVLDAGATDEGRPYFVMELVKGVPITEFCDKNHLPPEGRLKLFRDVCHAIQHAHHKGVIHRDIKPTNVMVTLHDGVPVVKVIDFGVAKATVQKLTEKTLFTAYGQMIGTPAYMSPEQAEMSGLDIDTRSDVYSLGVLLYELLTGTTPLESKRLREAGYAEMQRLIREEEPARPSNRVSSLGDSATVIAGNRGVEVKRLARLLAGDLDLIALKALEKDRGRRYETPATFADDVERYLRGEPIVARSPSTAYQMMKFAQRHRTAMLTVIMVAAALLLGTAVATWQALRATQAEAEARTALIDAEEARRAEATQRELAQRRADEAKHSDEDARARAAEAEAVLGFVQDRVLSAARPQGEEGGLGRDVTLRRAVEAALPWVARSFADHPITEARLRETMGKTLRMLGDLPGAIEQHEASRILFQKCRAPDHPDTLTAANNLATAYDLAGRTTDALLLRAQILTIRQAKLGPDHPDTLKSMNNLAISYAAVGRHAEALRLREQVFELAKATLGPDHPDTLTKMANLAISYTDLGRHTEALELNERTLARRQVTLGPDHPYTLQTMTNLANSLQELGRFTDALKLRQMNFELSKTKLGPDHPSTLTSINNLANIYTILGRQNEAVVLHQQALAARKAKLGFDHPDSLQSMNNLADSYAALGHHDDALALREQTLALRKSKLGPEHPHTLLSMHNLADSYRAVGRHADALRLREQTLGLRKARLGADHSDTLATTAALAESYLILGRDAEARALVDNVLLERRERVAPLAVLGESLVVRSALAVKVQDAATCRDSAERFERLERTDFAGLYLAARLRALLARAVVSDGKTSQHEVEKAMMWLTKAIAAGYKDAAHMRTDKDLDILRDRADFNALLAELEKKQAAR